MSELTNPHDKFFKETFGRLEVARDFFARYLPEAVTAVLDLNTLERQSDSFIDPDLQEQFADLLYQVNLHDGQEAYLYLLLEHKSYSDPQVPFQLLRYLVRIWERDVQAKEPLRPIVPVVVYHGRQTWRVATDFGDLFSGPDVLRPYWPSFQYQLQDLSAMSDEEIAGVLQLQVGLFVLKYIFDSELQGRLGEILSLFKDLLEAQSVMEYLRTVLYYIGKAAGHLDRQEMIEIVVTTLRDKGNEAMQTPAQQWIEEGIQQGIEQGIEQGQQQARYDIARQLLKLHTPLTVSEITGLTLSEVQKITDDRTDNDAN